MFKSLYDGQNTEKNIANKIDLFNGNIKGFYDYLIRYAKNVKSDYKFNKKLIKSIKIVDKN